jgi:trans-aconitate methyltransferase
MVFPYPPPAGQPLPQAGKQTWDAAGYAKNARFVADLGADILAWLDPKPGERILDLGCGDGVLTQRIAAAGADVIGVDSSDSFVTAAATRGLDARRVDGQSLGFNTEFDAVFSNAALHWMPQAEAVIAGVRRALEKGGRFVAEFGGHGNVAAIITAMRAVGLARKADLSLAHPWFFPTADEYRMLLEKGRLRVDRIALVPRPTALPTGLSGWLSTFRKPFFDQFGDADRAAALNEVEALLRPTLCDGQGRWTADYVRLRVHATAL